MVETNLSGSPLELNPHVRTRLLAANLVGTKVVDGIARLLTKSDVQAMAKKEKRAVVQEAESMLADAWSSCNEYCKNNKLSFEKLCILMG